MQAINQKQQDPMVWLKVQRNAEARRKKDEKSREPTGERKSWDQNPRGWNRNMYDCVGG
jgi:hypothetical protein